MLGLPPSVRIYFATELADMRNGIDGLRALVEGTLKHDPYAGHLLSPIASDRGGVTKPRDHEGPRLTVTSSAAIVTSAEAADAA